MTETYLEMEARHTAIDEREYDMEYNDRWAPRRLSPSQCEYCQRYSMDSPGKGWLNVPVPTSGSVWVEQWRGFFVHCNACNLEAVGPEPSQQYNCLHCYHMAHDPCSYDPEQGPGDMTCYVCGVLKKYVFKDGKADCNSKHWVPRLEDE